jgi:putative Mg2+ transporter-C (MgtC) family protein
MSLLFMQISGDKVIPLSIMLLRLGLALVFGIAIGIEREYRARPAGMRTMALISLGSCLFMLLSMFGFEDLQGLPHTQIDPSRVASYVVAGIGFLGGGSIFLNQAKDRVRGLTTAATVWVVAAIGLACGAGMLLIAFITTVLTLLVLVGLRFSEKLYSPRKAIEDYMLTLETNSTSDQFLQTLHAIFDRLDVQIFSTEVHKEQLKTLITFGITFKKYQERSFDQLIDTLSNTPEIQSFSLTELDEQ